jgi:5-methylcytosine-specific restriction protein A
VYALTVGEDIKYVGECEDLARRFGPLGYGHVSPRNCHTDGQATNCKVNSLVLQASGDQDRVHVWFLEAADRKAVESRLIQAVGPPWNGRLRAWHAPAPLSHPDLHDHRADSRPSSFHAALDELFHEAERTGRRSVQIRAGDLHKRVGGYPGPSHKMPQCCRAMRDVMSPGDVIIQSPPSGSGASLVIEYLLPRTVRLQS